MSLTKEDVHKLIDVDIRASTTQDPDLILTASIREYWASEPISA